MLAAVEAVDVGCKGRRSPAMAEENPGGDAAEESRGGAAREEGCTAEELSFVESPDHLYLAWLWPSWICEEYGSLPSVNHHR